MIKRLNDSSNQFLIISSCQTKQLLLGAKTFHQEKEQNKHIVLSFLMWFATPSERNSAVKLRNENQMVHHEVLESILFNR